MICAGCGKVIKKFEEYCSECAALLPKGADHTPENFEVKSPVQTETRAQTAIEEIQEAKPPTHIKSTDSRVVELKIDVLPPTVVSTETRAVQEALQPHMAPVVAERTDRTVLKTEDEEEKILLKEVRGPPRPPEHTAPLEDKRAERDKEVQEEIRRLREELERLKSEASQTKRETRPAPETSIVEPAEVPDHLDSVIERISPQRFDPLDAGEKEKEEQRFGRREDAAAPSTHTRIMESEISTVRSTPLRQTQYSQTRPLSQPKTTAPPAPQRTGSEFQRPYEPQVGTRPSHTAETRPPEPHRPQSKTIAPPPTQQRTGLEFQRQGPQAGTRPPHTVETKPTGAKKGFEMRAREKLQIIEETLYSCPHCKGEFRIDDSEAEKRKAGGGMNEGEPAEEEYMLEKIVICPHCRKEIILGQTEKSLF